MSVVPIGDVPPFVVMTTRCPSPTRGVGVVSIIFIICGVAAVLVVPARLRRRSFPRVLVGVSWTRVATGGCCRCAAVVWRSHPTGARFAMVGCHFYLDFVLFLCRSMIYFIGYYFHFLLTRLRVL